MNMKQTTVPSCTTDRCARQMAQQVASPAMSSIVHYKTDHCVHCDADADAVIFEYNMTSRAVVLVLCMLLAVVISTVSSSYLGYYGPPGFRRV